MKLSDLLHTLDGSERILIIGSSGAGKSTLATQLSKGLALPLIHLDQTYWKPGWIRTERAAWRRQVGSMSKRSKWIMDGNYANSLDIRLERADTVIFLDVNRFTCLYRALKRRVLDNRVDPIDGSPERISADFVVWLLFGFPSRKQQLVAQLKEYSTAQGGRVIRTKSVKP